MKRSALPITLSAMFNAVMLGIFGMTYAFTNNWYALVLVSINTLGCVLSAIAAQRYKLE